MENPLTVRDIAEEILGEFTRQLANMTPHEIVKVCEISPHRLVRDYICKSGRCFGDIDDVLYTQYELERLLLQSTLDKYADPFEPE